MRLGKFAVLRRREDSSKVPLRPGKPAALNAGLAQASGEWIAIMDSDDSAAPEYLGHLYATARKTGADLVQCGYELVYPECRIPRDSRWACTAPHSLAQFPELLFLDNTNWNKLYRMRMLKKFNIRFDEELKMAEDLPFFFQTLLAANRIIRTVSLKNTASITSAHGCFIPR